MKLDHLPERYRQNVSLLVDAEQTAIDIIDACGGTGELDRGRVENAIRDALVRLGERAMVRETLNSL